VRASKPNLRFGLTDPVVSGTSLSGESQACGGGSGRPGSLECLLVAFLHALDAEGWQDAPPVALPQ